MIQHRSIPLSLYIHLPWCIKKCPYCDFNSFTQTEALPEAAYVDALINDLDQERSALADRPIVSIFMGGGTPSLFSPAAIKRLLEAVHARLPVLPNAEITMEANPGTFEQARFDGFQAAGVNRLSLGVQSFNSAHLQKLGRIHGAEESLTAVAAAQKMGFAAINIDLMYGLPQQTVDEALADLKQALALAQSHLSWYHLTIEPNTAFYRQPPVTPDETITEAIETGGKALISAHQFQQYEVSAYSQPNQRCVHNINYWQFGDYLGIGAGAHSKITQPNGEILRFCKQRLPHHYLNPQLPFTSNQHILAKKDICFEFMLNAMRLSDGFAIELFETRTGLRVSEINHFLTQAVTKGMLSIANQHVTITAHGKRFLNDLTGIFL